MFGQASHKVAHALSEYAGATAFFYDIDGNNGDELLRRASLEHLKLARIAIAPSITDSDLAVVRGNGAMTTDYLVTVQRLVRFAEHYPGPLIVLPSSWGVDLSILEPLFGRHAPTILFARESDSLALLDSKPHKREVKVVLDHDVALGVDVGSLPFSHVQNSDYHLIALRTDCEQRSPLSSVENARTAYHTLPAGLRKRLRPAAVAAYGRLEAARHSKLMDSKSGNRYVGDVSDPSMYSFEDFCRIVNEAESVTTSRLHTGILAALLGKPTSLLPGRTSKIEGVYRQSLAEFPHVRFVRG